ncbi:MAG: hypothetical protein M0R06_06350 [Sphaerochaeta sp.]|jgi:hypothetical protein|nr:hypothetical protein [Sphaerochaeta sp.]
MEYSDMTAEQLRLEVAKRLEWTDIQPNDRRGGILMGIRFDRELGLNLRNALPNWPESERDAFELIDGIPRGWFVSIERQGLYWTCIIGEDAPGEDRSYTGVAEGSVTIAICMAWLAWEARAHGDWLAGLQTGR